MIENEAARAAIFAHFELMDRVSPGFTMYMQLDLVPHLARPLWAVPC